MQGRSKGRHLDRVLTAHFIPLIHLCLTSAWINPRKAVSPLVQVFSSTDDYIVCSYVPENLGDSTTCALSRGISQHHDLGCIYALNQSGREASSGWKYCHIGFRDSCTAQCFGRLPDAADELYVIWWWR